MSHNRIDPQEIPETHISRYQAIIGVPSPRFNPPPSPQETFENVGALVLPEAMGTDEGLLRPGETARDGIARIYRRFYAKAYGLDTAGMSTTELIDQMAYFIFPNTMPWPTLSYPLFYRMLPDPDDPEWCSWETMLFVPFSGERPPSAPVLKLGPEDSFMDLGLGEVGVLFQQDAEQLPAVQRGMHNLASGMLTVSEYLEVRIRHYHQTLDHYLGSDGPVAG